MMQVAVEAGFVRLVTQPERLGGTYPATEHACRPATVVILLQLLEMPCDCKIQVAAVAGFPRLEVQLEL